jgi:hypothetical protein
MAIATAVMTLAEAIAELWAHGPGWVEHSVDRHGRLIDDG